jgi:hypothetical protein
MLAVETTDNWGWIVKAKVGTSAYATYTNQQADAVSSMQAFVAWLNDGARPWASSGTAWAWRWARNTASSSEYGGGLLTLYRTAGTADLTVQSAGGSDPGTFPATTGIPYFTGQPSKTGTASARGTWAPLSQIAIRNFAQQLEAGDAGGNLVVRPGVQGTANTKPKCNATCTVQETSRLSAVLASASNPRRSYAWQEHTSSWLRLALGGVTWTRNGATFYDVTLDVSGGVM